VLLGPLPPFRSGIADQTLRLARALARVGEPPRVVSFRRLYPSLLYPGAAERGPGGFPEDLHVEACLDGRNPASFFRAGAALAETSPRLVIVPWWTAFLAPHVAALFAALDSLSPGATRLALCHNLADHEAGPFRRALVRVALSRADRLAVQNAGAAAEARELFPGSPVAVVPHPSEPRATSERSVARARLGLPPTDPIFLFSGLLRPYKGWDVLLSAFELVRREVPQAALVLAGEPWGEARGLLHGPAPPGVRLLLRYLGEEERGLLFDACDAVVCPYRHATGSGIAADAIAHGRAVVGTRVDGLLDVVEDGVSGLLVPPGDAAALSAAMRRLIREGLSGPLGQGAAARREEFSPEEHARRILSLGGLA
jgi:glycosyltransferase involved in cell wall biosynthesis